MIVLDCEQGSPEWHAARLGVITASKFGELVTPGGKPTTGGKRENYLNSLIAERLTGKKPDGFTSDAMRRGTELEPLARDNYAFLTDCEIEQVGLAYLDDRKTIACSPDGLVGLLGLWECKCPLDHTHVGYLRSGKMPGVYTPQVQGQLWVTGREWCDFMSFHPGMPPLIVRVEHDEAYIKILSNEVERLAYDVAQAVKKLEAKL